MTTIFLEKTPTAMDLYWRTMRSSQETCAYGQCGSPATAEQVHHGATDDPESGVPVEWTVTLGYCAAHAEGV